MAIMLHYFMDTSVFSAISLWIKLENVASQKSRKMRPCFFESL